MRYLCRVNKTNTQKLKDMKKYSVVWTPCEGTVDNPSFFTNRKHTIGSDLNQQEAINLYDDEMRSYTTQGGEVVETAKHDRFFKLNEHGRIFECVDIFEQ